jgi:primosomal protein N' (replication factor Y)
MPEPVNTVLRVALPVPLARLFDYLPPPSAAVDSRWIGRRVRVPFAKGELIGVVAGIGPAESPTLALKTIAESFDDEPLLAGELLDSLRWAARYYHAPLGETFATALPAMLRAGQPLPETRAFAWRLTEAGPHRPCRLAQEHRHPAPGGKIAGAGARRRPPRPGFRRLENARRGRWPSAD